MIRSCFIFLVALVSVAGCKSYPVVTDAAGSVHSQANHLADMAAIKALAANYQTAYLKGDPAAISRLYADDAVIHPANESPVRGRTDLDRYFTANYTEPVNEILTTVAIVISTAGDMAYEIGSTKSATGAGKYLTIYRKTNGRWLIAADTWSHDTPPSTLNQGIAVRASADS